MGSQETSNLQRGFKKQKMLLELNFKGQIGDNHLKKVGLGGLILKAEGTWKLMYSGNWKAFTTDSVKCLPMWKRAVTLCVGC